MTTLRLFLKIFLLSILVAGPAALYAAEELPLTAEINYINKRTNINNPSDSIALINLKIKELSGTLPSDAINLLQLGGVTIPLKASPFPNGAELDAMQYHCKQHLRPGAEQNLEELYEYSGIFSFANQTKAKMIRCSSRTGTTINDDLYLLFNGLTVFKNAKPAVYR